MSAATRGWVDATRVRRDVETLAGMVRSSAGAGERGSAEWIAGRLGEADGVDVRVEPFRYQGTYAWVHAAHAVAGLVASRTPGLPGAALALAAAGSLELDASGRRQWARSLFPASEGANVVARVPASGVPRATLVLVAHHDAARTGLVFHERLAQVGAARRLARRRIDPLMAPAGAAYVLVAAGALLGRTGIGAALRGAGRALLRLGVALEVDIATSKTVPGANDNATGVAGLLALAERFAAHPLAGVDVIAVAPGCEESGMGGMAAFLREHAEELDPARTVVVSLDTIGSGTPIVCSGEGALLEHRYRDEDLALADAGARRAGVDEPQRWRIGGWTDPVLALFAGLPAISLLSVGEHGSFTHYHHPTDLPDHVDWECVEHCVEIAGGIAEELAAQLPAN